MSVKFGEIKLELCATAPVIRPILNINTGQQEFPDQRYFIVVRKGYEMIAHYWNSKKLERWIRHQRFVFIVDRQSQNSGEPLISAKKLTYLFHGRLTVQYCPICGTSITITNPKKNGDVFSRKANRSGSSRKFEIAPEELRELVLEMPTSEIAYFYGVSDRAIEKACKAFGFPRSLTGYWSES